MKYKTVKRILDIIISIILIILLAPMMLIIFVTLKCNDRHASAFFVHSRVGKNNKTIKVYKFRTMIEGAEHSLEILSDSQRQEFYEHFKVKDDPRVTKIGKFLRKTSLDELPQFINVLKGDMSIVGPRPLIKDELQRYGKNKEKLLSVMPGLTGNWVINNKYKTSYVERMNLELYYVDNMSFKLDLKIFFKTVFMFFIINNVM